MKTTRCPECGERCNVNRLVGKLCFRCHSEKRWFNVSFAHNGGVFSHNCTNLEFSDDYVSGIGEDGVKFHIPKSNVAIIHEKYIEYDKHEDKETKIN